MLHTRSFENQASATEQALSRVRSEQAAFRETENSVTGDDEMIEHTDLDEREDLLERLGEESVSTAWLRDAGRMVVGKCDVRSH